MEPAFVLCRGIPVTDPSYHGPLPPQHARPQVPRRGSRGWGTLKVSSPGCRCPARSIRNRPDSISNRYWFGVPDGDGRNLATCIWRDPEDARRGSVGKGHRRASMATKGLYTEWHIERLRLFIGDGAEDWTISDWRD